MLRMAVGLLLLVVGVRGFFRYHDALWSSGGPDTNSNVLLYLIPYAVTIALSLGGLMIGWKGFRAIRK